MSRSAPCNRRKRHAVRRSSTLKALLTAADRAAADPTALAWLRRLLERGESASNVFGGTPTK
jgi:hypothetical protein